MDKCSISVIMPAYNVENYICETLDSLANQTQAPDEIIIINDGSSDNTSALIRSHELMSNIKFIETENNGQGIARNIGVKEAKSENLYFFDSDDLLTEDFIEQSKKILISNDKPDIYLFSGKSFFDPMLKNSGFNPYYIRSFEGKYNNQQYFFDKLLKEPELSCSPCLYLSKRSLWCNNKLAFNSFYHEDEELFYPLLFNASTYVISKEVFFLRRIRSDSTMTNKKEVKHAEGQGAILSSLLEMIDKGNYDKFGTKLIRRRLGLFYLSYVSVSINSGKSINFILLVRSILASRSVKAPLKAIKRIVKPLKIKTDEKN